MWRALLTIVCLAPALAGMAQERGGPRERREGERAIVEFHEGDLSQAEADAFLALVDKGIADVEGVVAKALPAASRRAGRVRFVVSRSAGMSSTYGRTVVLPLERVRSRTAPYLHETVHALVPTRGDGVWLSEGLASYLESWVSENRGGYDAHVFTRAGDRGIHAAARRVLGDPAGRAVLPWVGGEGEPPQMRDDRQGVARPFYVLSQSFTKYIADAAGVEALVKALASGDQEALLHSTGRSVGDWRADWLRTLGG